MPEGVQEASNQTQSESIIIDTYYRIHLLYQVLLQLPARHCERA